VQGGGLPKAVKELAGLGPGVDWAGGHRTLDRPASGTPKVVPNCQQGGPMTVAKPPSTWSRVGATAGAAHPHT
jgi:hypothetical protein